MNIPGRRWVDTIMWTSVASELKWDANIQRSHLKQAELKVMRLLDTIFSEFSSTYRANREQAKHKVSKLMEEARQYRELGLKHVQKAVEKVLPNSNSNKKEEENYDLCIFEEPENFYRKPEVVQPKNDDMAQPSFKQEDIPSGEEIDPKQLLEESLIEHEDQEIKEQSSSLDQQAAHQDEEVERQVTEESVDRQIEIDKSTVAQKEKPNVELKSQDLAPVEQIQHYLEENPAAVKTASEICQQMIVSSWDEAFGGLEDDVFTTFNPNIEKAAAKHNAQLPLAVREWLKSEAFKKDLSENLGTLAGFFLILRRQLQAGHVGTVIKIFQAMREKEEIDFWTTEQEAEVEQEDFGHLSLAPDAQDVETKEVKNKFKEELIEILAKETKACFEAFEDLDVKELTRPQTEEELKLEEEKEKKAESFNQAAEADALYHKEQRIREIFKDLSGLDVEELTRPQTEEELKLEEEREKKAESFNQARAEADALYHKEQRIRELFKDLSGLDVEELTRPQTEEELRLEIEREAKIQAYEEEKFLAWLRSNEFKRNLIENPVTLAGVLILVQALFREGAMSDLYKVLKAIGWDTEKSAFNFDEIVELTTELKEDAKDTQETDTDEKNLGD